MKIYYNGQEQFKLDKRFEDEKWFWRADHRSDPRINRKPKYWSFHLKAKHIAWFIFWAVFIILCQYVDRGYLVQNKLTQIPVTKVEAKVPEIPVENINTSNPGKSIEQLIRDKFGKDGDKAVKIAYCESRLNPNDVNPHDPILPSVGLFQINLTPDRGLTIEQMKNPQENIDYAYMLFSRHNGFSRDWKWCNGHS